MLKSVKWLSFPPVFPDDEEKTSKARIFNVISLSITAFLALMAFGLLFIFVRKAGVATTLLVLLTLLLISRALAHSGRIRLASMLLVSGMWVVFTVNVWLSGGLNSVMAGFYMAITVLAGVLLGPRAAIAIAALSAGTGLAITVLEVIGYPPPRYYPLPPTPSLVVLIFWLMLTVPAVTLALQDFANALSIARNKIKERDETQEALRQSEESYRQLVENLNDAIFATDSRGIVTYVSPPVERILGYQPSELIGQHFSFSFTQRI
jgi:PAS domain-containing protein